MHQAKGCGKELRAGPSWTVGSGLWPPGEDGAGQTSHSQVLLCGERPRPGLWGHSVPKSLSGTDEPWVQPSPLPTGHRLGLSICANYSLVGDACYPEGLCPAPAASGSRAIFSFQSLSLGQGPGMQVEVGLRHAVGLQKRWKITRCGCAHLCPSFLGA